MRKGIAEHMRRSLDTSAHVTSAIEVDMSKVVAIRAEAEEGVRGRLRRQPDLPRVHRPGDRRDAAGVPVDQRRDPRRQDRHAQLRQPRLRRRAGGRQGPDRPGREALRGPEPARDGARGRRDRRPRTGQEADARRGPGRHVHDHEPRRLRHLPRHAGDQPAAGRDPRHLRGRQAAVGDPGRARPGRDRDPPDHEPDAHVRPPPGRRRARRPLPARPAQEARELGRATTSGCRGRVRA